MLPARRWSEGPESSEQPDSGFEDDAATRIAPKNIRFARRDDETKLYSKDERASLLVQGMLSAERDRNERTAPAYVPGPMRGRFSTIPDEIETIEADDNDDREDDTRELAARQEQSALARIEGLVQQHRPSGIERIKPPLLPSGLVQAQARSGMPEMFGKRPAILLEPEEAQALLAQARAANEIARTSPRPVRLAQEMDAALADTQRAPRKGGRWILSLWLLATVVGTSYAAVRYMPGSAGADFVQNIVSEVSTRVLPLLGR